MYSFFKGYVCTGKLQQSTLRFSVFMYSLSQNYSDPYVPKGYLFSFPRLPFYCLSPTLWKKDTLSPSWLFHIAFLQGDNTSTYQRLLECHCKGWGSKWLMTNKFFDRSHGLQVLLLTKVEDLQLSYQLTDHLKYFWR